MIGEEVEYVGSTGKIMNCIDLEGFIKTCNINIKSSRKSLKLEVEFLKNEIQPSINDLFENAFSNNITTSNFDDYYKETIQNNISPFVDNHI